MSLPCYNCTMDARSENGNKVKRKSLIFFHAYPFPVDEKMLAMF